MAWYREYGGWPACVPVATRIARARKTAEKLRKKGVDIQPVELSGKKIASSFWGKGWCDYMESFHDYDNRLPRGRSYVRNGSVVHLEIDKGIVKAMVAGSDTYRVEIKVNLLSPKHWRWVKKCCAGQISSLLDLLEGRLSDGVMRIVSDRVNGLFPGPDEFTMHCNCPDHAYMCKHIAAALYGVGARLDLRPELLFLLRGVDYAELVADGGVEAVISNSADAGDQLAAGELSDIFGIELIGVDKTIGAPDKQIKLKAQGTGKAKAPGAAKPKKAAPTEKKRNPASKSKEKKSKPASAVGAIEKATRKPPRVKQTKKQQRRGLKCAPRQDQKISI